MNSRQHLLSTSLCAALACGGRTIDAGEYGGDATPCYGNCSGAGGAGSSAVGGKPGGGGGKSGRPVMGGAPGSAGFGAIGGAVTVTGGAMGMGASAGTISVGGSGGITSCGVVGSGYPVLIDDMEDGDALILFNDGRQGGWFVYNDGTGMQVPSGQVGSMPLLDVARDMSTRGAHTYGSGFATWGAGIGFALAAGCMYDASAHLGFSFWARASSAQTARLMVNTGATSPPESGGYCKSGCYDSFGAPIALSNSWNEYAVSFYDLAQQGWGTPASFDPSELLTIQFQVSAYQAFDFWIDDIEFL